jgi:N6-adenosine-specific RNA methylase IME4
MTVRVRRVRRFCTLYVDPPWDYRNRRTGGSMSSGAVQQYTTLSTAALCALPVERVTAPNAVLWLWATGPMLPDALTVLVAWGFTYKTIIPWQKTGRWGMGFWIRQQYEFLLLGVRGTVRPLRIQRPNVFAVAPTGHSRKPGEFRALIEQYSPSPWLELFATVPAPGWTQWGHALGTDVGEQLSCA